MIQNKQTQNKLSQLELNLLMCDMFYENADIIFKDVKTMRALYLK